MDGTGHLLPLQRREMPLGCPSCPGAALPLPGPAGTPACPERCASPQGQSSVPLSLRVCHRHGSHLAGSVELCRAQHREGVQLLCTSAPSELPCLSGIWHGHVPVSHGQARGLFVPVLLLSLSLGSALQRQPSPASLPSVPNPGREHWKGAGLQSHPDSPRGHSLRNQRLLGTTESKTLGLHTHPSQ